VLIVSYIAFVIFWVGHGSYSYISCPTSLALILCLLQLVMCSYDKELNEEDARFWKENKLIWECPLHWSYNLDKPILDGGHDLLVERNMMARATKVPS